MEQEFRSTRMGLGRIISVGFQFWWKNLLPILPIILIVYIPINFGLSFIPVEELVEKHGLRGLRIYMKLAQLAEFLIGTLATMAMARMFEGWVHGETITWTRALGHACSRWGVAIWTGILGGLIVFGMTLLLIVPGIIWWLYYCMFVYVVALRGRSGKAALDYAKAFVKGQWWRVLGYMIVIQLVVAIPCVILGVGFAFLSESRIVEIASDTLVDILGAASVAMTTAFFLNNDYLVMRKESSGSGTAQPNVTSVSPAT